MSLLSPRIFSHLLINARMFFHSIIVGLRHQDLSAATEQCRDQSQPVLTAESNSDTRQFSE